MKKFGVANSRTAVAIATIAAPTTAIPISLAAINLVVRWAMIKFAPSATVRLRMVWDNLRCVRTEAHSSAC